MGIFEFIFGKPVRIENEFFGIMRFSEDKKNTFESYFECRRHFSPSDKTIQINIDGDITGPTKKQIDFYKAIEDNYSAISQAITPLIEDELGNWKEGFKINDFQKEFEPVHLQLPRCESQPVVWEIAFESDHDRNHTFTLTMSDFDATAILVDG